MIVHGYATAAALEAAQERYDNSIQSSNVDWKELVQQQARIDGLQDGLDKLKALRINLFPNKINNLLALLNVLP